MFIYDHIKKKKKKKLRLDIFYNQTSDLDFSPALQFEICVL